MNDKADDKAERQQQLNEAEAREALGLWLVDPSYKDPHHTDR